MALGYDQSHAHGDEEKGCRLRHSHAHVAERKVVNIADIITLSKDVEKAASVRAHRSSRTARIGAAERHAGRDQGAIE